MGVGRAGGPRPPASPPAAGAGRDSSSSTSVFQASHDGHRPVQRGALPPHSVHRWTVFTFAMGATLRRGCHTVGDPVYGACVREDRGPASAAHRKAEERLRAFALDYPEAIEDFPWGERAIKVRKKVFAFMLADGSGLYLTTKLPESAPAGQARRTR